MTENEERAQLIARLKEFGGGVFVDRHAHETSTEALRATVAGCEAQAEWFRSMGLVDESERDHAA